MRRLNNQKSDPLCPEHKLIIIKIQTQTKRLLCEKCMSETEKGRKIRLETVRAELTNQYTKELESLKVLKVEVDKMVQTFISHNMVEAKRKVKKQQIETQKLIDGILEQEIRDSNRMLKKYIEEQLKGWESINGQKFDLAYIEFEKEAPSIEERIKIKKQELKTNIKERLKRELKKFYERIFNF